MERGAVWSMVGSGDRALICTHTPLVDGHGHVWRVAQVACLPPPVHLCCCTLRPLRLCLRLSMHAPPPLLAPCAQAWMLYERICRHPSHREAARRAYQRKLELGWLSAPGVPGPNAHRAGAPFRCVKGGCLGGEGERIRGWCGIGDS